MRLSTEFRRLRAMLFGGAAFIFFAFSQARSQDLVVTIHVRPESRRAIIEGHCPPAAQWSFRDTYAGILGLGNRIEGLRLSDHEGAEIPVRKLAPGQFDAAKPASQFRYEVNLGPPAKALDVARVSWLTPERGLLLPGDLLPQIAPANLKPRRSVRATVQLKLPESWQAYSNQGEAAAVNFELSDINAAVFVLGPQLRTTQLTESGMALRLVADGAWAFADRDVLEMAGKVLRSDRETFGAMPAKQGTLILLPFPHPIGASEWSAETRGSTVTLLMGRLPSKVGALAQLSTPLTHELFHFWVPNGLALEGDYDWFYEGFTMYQATRTAVRLELLTFPEFLNAIARAFDGYLADSDRDRWSLLEASKRRWTNGAVSVYSKSMLVAFLLDLKMRSQSRGKRSLDSVYQSLFSQRGVPASEKPPQVMNPADGNDVVLAVLANEAALRDSVRVLIREPFGIDLQEELAQYGLIVERLGLRTRIAVSEKPDKRQRDLLRELGYNDVVRSPRRQ